MHDLIHLGQHTLELHIARTQFAFGFLQAGLGLLQFRVHPLDLPAPIITRVIRFSEEQHTPAWQGKDPAMIEHLPSFPPR